VEPIRPGSIPGLPLPKQYDPLKSPTYLALQEMEDKREQKPVQTKVYTAPTAPPAGQMSQQQRVSNMSLLPNLMGSEQGSLGPMQVKFVDDLCVSWVEVHVFQLHAGLHRVNLKKSSCVSSFDLCVYDFEQ
jgi:hypothetical protein